MKAAASLMMIVRDEPLLEQAIASFRPYVSQVCLTIDDDAPAGMVALAHRIADRVAVEPWVDSFAHTRNVCMALATEPHLIWGDADDILENGQFIAREIEQADRTHRGGRLLAPYDYEVDSDGRVTRQQWRERIVPNDGTFTWVHPTHESLVKKNGVKPIDPGTDYWMRDVRWVHKRKETGARSRSLNILRKWHAAGHDDAWVHLNLALELHSAGQFAEAIEHFAKHVDMSGWDEERVMACLRAADCALAMDIAGKDGYNEPAGWIQRALEIAPNAFEPLFAQAKLSMMAATMLGREGSMADAVGCCREALATPETRTPIGRNPQERAFDVYELMRTAAEVEQDWATALEATEKALLSRPGMPQLVLAKKRYTAAKLVASFAVESEAPEKPKIKIEDWAGKPPKVQDYATGNPWAQRLSPPWAGSYSTRQDGRPLRLNDIFQIPGFEYPDRVPLDIVFLCGPAADPWNPELVEKYGAGGSETAVVEMAKRLAKMGHKVRVFNTPGIEGTYDGVDYEQWTSEVKPKCDVAVVWRLAQLLPQAEAKTRIAWPHDIEMLGMSYGYSLLADKVLALSKWHADALENAHGIPKSQIHMTRNGLDVRHYMGQNPVRKADRAVYISSADRGLGALLDMWPEIKKRVPGAELSVAYGMTSWERQADERKDENHRLLISMLKRRMRELPGVTHHGRMNKRDLAHLLRTSGALLYPTWWTETNCLAVQESRAAGLRIVTSPIAALNETAGEHAVMIDGDWVSEDYQRRFVDAAVDALGGSHQREEISRIALRELGWDSVAEDWVDLMHDLLLAAKYGAIPEYREYRNAAA